MEEYLAQTIPRIWNKLPVLFGSDWPRIERELWELLRRLETDESGAGEAILKLFSAYPQAYALLQSATDEVGNSEIEAVGKGAERDLHAIDMLPAGSSVMERHVVVPVLFGTDRELVDNRFAEIPNEGVLKLGVAQVSIPEDHRMGVMEHPPWWQFGFGWDPNEHVTVLSVRELDRMEFIAQSIATLTQGGVKQALVFIHGFSVGFADAARRTAQLAYDLKFRGLPMFYSWPSMGKLRKTAYQVDEDRIIQTRPRLQEFLRLVTTELGVEAVHLIAHSMGNRALTDILQAVATNLPKNAAPLDQVIFAAPDVNARVFQDLAATFCEAPKRCTLYASSEDRALKYSNDLHKSPRAGDSGAYLLLMKGVDTIDSTAVRTDFVGHSYYGDNSSIISDIFELIRDSRPPDDRSCLRRRGNTRRYWVFQAGSQK